MPKVIAYCLGFPIAPAVRWLPDDYTIIRIPRGSRGMTAQLKPDVNFFSPSNINVYTDIVEPSHVGHSVGRILKCVNLPVDQQKDHGAYYHYESRSLEWHNVSYKDVHTMDVELRALDGNLLEYVNQDAKIYMTLAFRKRV